MNWDSTIMLAALFAGLSVAAFICAIFYSVIEKPPLANRRSAVFEALLKGRANASAPITRSARRAQEAALKSVAQHGKATRQSKLAMQLAAAGLDWPVRRYVVICALAGGLLFRLSLALGLSSATALLAAGLAAWLLPQRYLAICANRRRRAFLKAFSSAIDMIVRGVRSGLSLTDCLSMVASDAPAPVADEFDRIVAQLRAGVPLPIALEKLNAAMPVPEVRFFVMIMSTHSQTGGNLGDALSNLAGVLRDRDKLAAKIRIASAEGNSSALIIGALPFVVIGAAAAFAPDYISFLWTDEAGRRVAALCAVWLVAGIVVLGRMARIEV